MFMADVYLNDMVLKADLLCMYACSLFVNHFGYRVFVTDVEE